MRHTWELRSGTRAITPLLEKGFLSLLAHALSYEGLHVHTLRKDSGWLVHAGSWINLEVFMFSRSPSRQETQVTKQKVQCSSTSDATQGLKGVCVDGGVGGGGWTEQQRAVPAVGGGKSEIQSSNVSLSHQFQFLHLHASEGLQCAWVQVRRGNRAALCAFHTFRGVTLPAGSFHDVFLGLDVSMNPRRPVCSYATRKFTEYLEICSEVGKLSRSSRSNDWTQCLICYTNPLHSLLVFNLHSRGDFMQTCELLWGFKWKCLSSILCKS